MQISGLNCHQFVDDTQQYFALLVVPREAVEILNCCLEAVLDWMQVNQLKLYKMEELLTSRSPDKDLRCRLF